MRGFTRTTAALANFASARFGRRFAAVLLGCMTVAVGVLPAGAQQFPDRAIKVILPYPAGGAVDILARGLGEAFRQRTGHGFVIEARAGANTALAAMACKGSAPDGYTLCLLASTTMSLNPHLYKNLRYAPSDMTPVTNIALSRAIFLLHKDVPVNTLAELVEWSKKNPEKMNYGSFGVGGETHLIMEWLKNKTGAQITHVPFTGFTPAQQAFDRGDIQVFVPPAVPAVMERIEMKQAKAIMVLGDLPSPNLPNLPTIPQSGLPPVGVQTWFGMLAPAGTPPHLVEKLSAELRAIVADKEFADKFIRGIGLVPETNTPLEFKAFLERDYINAGELVKLTGIKLADQ